jgi:hypothetical protein
MDGGNGPVYQFSSGETMQIQSSSNVFGKPGFYQAKNANWEEFAFDGSGVWRYRDVSEGYDSSVGQNKWYCLYASSSTSAPGATWVSRNMKVGDYYSINAYVRHWYDNCQLRLQGSARQEHVRLEEVIGNYNLGGQPFVTLRLKGYWDTTFTKAYEEWYYAQGMGLVKWICYDTSGTTQVQVNQFTGWGGSAPARRTVNCNP